MTEGKVMFVLLLIFLTGMAIGEIAYRLKRRKLKKESNLSDYGISLHISRAEYYAKGTACLIVTIMCLLFLAYMIHAWNKPL